VSLLSHISISGSPHTTMAVCSMPVCPCVISTALRSSPRRTIPARAQESIIRTFGSSLSNNVLGAASNSELQSKYGSAVLLAAKQPTAKRPRTGLARTELYTDYSMIAFQHERTLPRRIRQYRRPSSSTCCSKYFDKNSIPRFIKYSHIPKPA
jgi:hypothetical protein